MRSLRVLAVVLLIACVVWLVIFRDARVVEQRPSSLDRAPSGGATPPELVGRGTANDRPSSAATTLTVSSECGEPLGGARLVAGSKDRAPEADAHGGVSGPSGPDGSIAFDASALGDKASAVWVVAPGHKGVRIATEGSTTLVLGKSNKVVLSRETVVVCDLNWPAEIDALLDLRGVHVRKAYSPESEAGRQLLPQPTVNPGRHIGAVAGCGEFVLRVRFQVDREVGLEERRILVTASSPARVEVSMTLGATAAGGVRTARLSLLAETTDHDRVPGAVVKLWVERTGPRGPYQRQLRRDLLTDAQGEAQIDLPLGRYAYEVVKSGLRTAVGGVDLVANRRAVAVLRVADVELMVEIGIEKAPQDGIVTLSLWGHVAGTGEWEVVARLPILAAKPSAQFRIVRGEGHVVVAQARGLAAAAVTVPPAEAGQTSLTVALAINAGESIEVALPSDVVAEAGVLTAGIVYEGLLGKIFVVTTRLEPADGRWWLRNVAPEGGRVTLTIGPRKFEGSFAAKVAREGAVVRMRSS